MELIQSKYPLMCDECDEHAQVVIEFGSDIIGGTSFTFICAACIEKAYGLIFSALPTPEPPEVADVVEQAKELLKE